MYFSGHSSQRERGNWIQEDIRLKLLSMLYRQLWEINCCQDLCLAQMLLTIAWNLGSKK